eukprot:scaffold13528_cov126-Isochrysis_galbana.AAC.2
MQRLSKAAVVFDAKAIKKGAISLKQQACHVRPADVMGAMAAANANAGPLHGVSSAVLVVCCSVSSVCSCFISSVNGAKAIKKWAISLKQQACHVRPAAVMGAMAAANAVRGGGRA